MSAGGHHSHGQAVEVSEAKAEAEAALGAGGKHEHGHEELHAFIGVSLVLGFVFMLLVDQIGSSHVHNTEGQLQGNAKCINRPNVYRSRISMRRLSVV